MHWPRPARSESWALGRSGWRAVKAVDWKTRLRAIRLLAFGLILGLALLLALAYVLGVGPAWLIRPAKPELTMDGPIGALGPISLEWHQGPAPAPSSLTIDGAIAVRLSLEGNLLTLVPAEPLTAGAHTLSLQSVDGASTAWTFKVRQPEPLYLSRSEGQSSLYRWNSGNPLLLSAADSVRDYAPSQQGDWIAYAAINDQGGTDLWRVDRSGQGRSRLLSCGQDVCDQLAWDPAGTRLAFSRQPDSEPQRRRLWTVAVEAGTAAPLFQDETILGADPAWSPDGRWLAFYDPAVNGIRLLEADSLSQQVVPTRAGVSGAWSADSQSLYVPLLVYLGEEPATHLYQLVVAGRQLRPVLDQQGGWRQVGEPSLGLAGRWLALSGQRGSSAAVPEMWLVDLESAEARQLAGGDGLAYGGPSWDAAGQRLLFQRVDLGGGAQSPDLMLWNAGSDSAQLLVSGAGSAGWLQ